MVDSPARIECEICSERNTFDNASPSGVFSYSPCNGCGFPLLYRNTNPNQHALNRRTLEKYAEATQQWGADVKEDNRALQFRNRELESKNRDLQSEVRKLQARLADVSSSPISESLISENIFTEMLESSQHLRQMNQYIQDIGDRLMVIESKLLSTTLEADLKESQNRTVLSESVQEINDKLAVLENNLATLSIEYQPEKKSKREMGDSPQRKLRDLPKSESIPVDKTIPYF
jgi:archaellum component FlaC